MSQFSSNFAAYVGYAIINEPNVTLEYRVNKRIAINLEGAAFIPYVRQKYWFELLTAPIDRVNYRGGSLRTGVAIYGQWPWNRWLMHRVLFDVTYASSNLFMDDPGRFSGTQQVVVNEIYREFMQYSVFYECTFRLFAHEKRHHLFVRAGLGGRALHTRTVRSYSGLGGEELPVSQPYAFSGKFAPVFAAGYRFRLHPQKKYFAGYE